MSAADVVASVRRRMPWSRFADGSTSAADAVVAARRAIALQKTVEQIRDGAAVEDVLLQFSGPNIDERFVVTAYVASWLQGEARATSLLDVGGGINTRYLCGVLADHCETVWLCTSHRPEVVEITTPVIVRTSPLDEAFGDGRKFPLVTSLVGEVPGSVSSGASDELAGIPRSSCPCDDLRTRIDPLAGLVAKGGSILVTERLEELNSETPARNADDRKGAFYRHHFEPTVELLEKRGFSVDIEVIGIGDSTVWRLDSSTDAPETISGTTRMVSFVAARLPG
jgi:hypothetical protein